MVPENLRGPKNQAVAPIETFPPSWLAGWLGWLAGWLGWACKIDCDLITQYCDLKINSKSINFDGPRQFASNVQTCAFSYGTSHGRPRAVAVSISSAPVAL